MILKQKHSILVFQKFNNKSCIAVNAFTEFLGYKPYIVHEKESVATNFSKEAVMENFMQNRVPLRVYSESTP